MPGLRAGFALASVGPGKGGRGRTGTPAYIKSTAAKNLVYKSEDPEYLHDRRIENQSIGSLCTNIPLKICA